MGQALLKECKICGKPASIKYNPFCSERCAQVDLNRWLGEGYVIPTDEEPEQDPSERGD
jgi:endogenous inhibitor of DNA gyrase (YacG/DUF329 family)